MSAHNFVVFCLQRTSTVSEVLRCRSPFQSLPSRPIRRTLTQMRCRTVAVHRRWYRSLWAPTTAPWFFNRLRRYISFVLTYLPYLLTYPCCRKPHGFLHSFSLTGTIFLSIPSHFARIQSSRSQYFTSTNHLSCGFYFNFLLKACFRSLHAH